MENRQFKYVIVQMAEGEIQGTDDKRVAQEWATNDENMVIEMATCQVIEPPLNIFKDGEDIVFNQRGIQEQTLYVFE